MLNRIFAVLIITLMLSSNSLIYSQILLDDWTSAISSNDDITINDMVVDENNAVFYIVGFFKGDASTSFPHATDGSNQDFSSNNFGGKDGFIAKYDLVGNFIWAFNVGGQFDDEVVAIALDGVGDIYVSGIFDNATLYYYFEGLFTTGQGSMQGQWPTQGGGIDLFHIKYNASGTRQWGHIDGGAGDDKAADILINNDKVIICGSIYEEGEFGGGNHGTNNNSYQCFILNRDASDGDYNWVQVSNGAGDEYGKRVIENSNKIFFFGEYVDQFMLNGGSFPSSNSNPKIFYLKLENNGNHLSGGGFISDVKLKFEDATTNASSTQILLTGMYEGTLVYPGATSVTSSKEDIFLASLSTSNLSLNWHTEIQTQNSNDKASGKSVALMASDGDIFLGCDFENTLITGTTPINATTNKDGAILVLDNTGNYLSSVMATSSNDVDYSHLELAFADTLLYFFNNYKNNQYVQTNNNTGNSKTRGLYGRYGITYIPPSCDVTYASNSLCEDDVSPTPSYIEISGGVFSSTGAITLADVNTGEIDLSNSVGNGLVIYNVLGCADTTLFVVKPRFSPTVSNLPTSLCQTDTNIALMQFVTGDTDGVWYGSPLSQDTLQITTTVPSVNSISLTYANPSTGYCPASSNHTIALIPTFDPTWSFNPDTVCDGSGAIDLSALASSNNGTWSGVGVTGSQLNISGLNPGQYTITYSSPSGYCAASASDTITIMPQFNASISNIPNSICQNDTTIDLTNYNTGSTSGYWSGNLVQGNNLVITTAFTGNINLVYQSYPNTFCYNSSNAIISVLPSFDPSWNISPQICSYEPIIDLTTLVTGTPNGNWYGANISGSTLDVSTLTGSTYPITYSGIINGCGSDSTITIAIVNPISSAGMDDSICDLTYGLVGTASAGSYTWSSSSANIVFSNPNSLTTDVSANTSGYYTVLLTNQQGSCSYTDTMHIQLYEAPIVDAGTDQIVTTNQYTLDGSSNVSNNVWVVLDGNSNLSGDTDLNSEALNLSIGENIFELTGENGFCPSSSDEVIIHYNIVEIPNSFTPNNDGYNDKFVIVGLELFENPKFTIINKWGQVLEVFENYQNNWNGVIDGKELAKGTYFYTLELNENKYKGFIDLNK